MVLSAAFLEKKFNKQNILTPHMFTYSHANTSLGQSERARTILVIYKRCYQLCSSL